MTIVSGLSFLMYLLVILISGVFKLLKNKRPISFLRGKVFFSRLESQITSYLVILGISVSIVFSAHILFQAATGEGSNVNLVKTWIASYNFLIKNIKAENTNNESENLISEEAVQAKLLTSQFDNFYSGNR